MKDYSNQIIANKNNASQHLYNNASALLKTTNKKYYKRIDVPDLKRVNLKLEESSLLWKHQNNTLIIAYEKPDQVKERDQEMLRMAAKAANGQNLGN